MSIATSLANISIASIKGVGAKVAARLHKLDIYTLQDILFHLPLRYEDRTRVVPIGSLRNGDRAVVEGEIQLAEVVFRRRRTLLVRIFPDEPSCLRLVRALAVEIHEEWVDENRYLDMELLQSHRKAATQTQAA